MRSLIQYVLKFFAILKDSLQETLDSKVLYAMLVLSALAIVAAVSISFEPKSPEPGVQAILSRFPGAKTIGLGGREPPLRYELKDFGQTDEKKPWDSSFHFTIVVHEATMTGPDGRPQTVRGLFRFIVLITLLQKDEEQLNAKEREARQRFHQLEREAFHGKQITFEDLIKQVDASNVVMSEQMEDFIAKQLAAQGTVVTKSVRNAPEGNDDLRFEVETQPRAETFRTWPHKMTVGFGAYAMDNEGAIGNEVFFIEDFIIGGFGAGIAMLIASVVTSFYIPNMLRKGTVDLLLAKPIPRWLLLVYKYIGGLLFMLLNTTVVVVGIWLVLGLRSGLWGAGFLCMILVLTFQFAIFYAVSTVFGVTTRSPIVCILGACFAWVVLFVVGWGYRAVDGMREMDLLPKWVVTTTDTLHFLMPRYKDLDALSGDLTARDLLGPDSPERKALDKQYQKMGWASTLGFTLGYIAILLGFSCWWFASKDY